MTCSSENRLASGLVSVGKMLIAGIIVGVVLAALCVLYVLSDAGDRPFVNEKLQPSAESMLSGRF